MDITAGGIGGYNSVADSYNREMRALNAANYLDRKTKTIAAVHVESGMSADEAIVKAQEERSFGDMFKAARSKFG